VPRADSTTNYSPAGTRQDAQVASDGWSKSDQTCLLQVDQAPQAARGTADVSRRSRRATVSQRHSGSGPMVSRLRVSVCGYERSRGDHVGPGAERLPRWQRPWQANQAAPGRGQGRLSAEASFERTEPHPRQPISLPCSEINFFESVFECLSSNCYKRCARSKRATPKGSQRGCGRHE
jgi:hypothetical protein